MIKKISLLMMITLQLLLLAAPVQALETPVYKLTVSLNKTEVYAGDSIVLSGTVVKDNQPASNVVVTVKVTSAAGTAITDVDQLSTDAQGRFSTTLHINSDFYPIGQYTIFVKAAGTTENISFNVGERPVEIVLKDINILAPGTTVEVGSSLQLSLSGTMSDGSAAPATALAGASWTSSNSAIATVSNDGKVTGKNAGTVTITAAVGNIRDTITITVKAKPSSGDGGGGGVADSASNKKETEQGQATISKNSSGEISVELEVDDKKVENQLADPHSRVVAINAEIEPAAMQIAVTASADLLVKAGEKQKVVAIDMGDAVLSIPPQAIASPAGAKIEFSMQKMDEQTAKEILSQLPDKEIAPASLVFDFNLYTAQGNNKEKAKLNGPLTITLKYDQTKVKDSRKLGIYYYNEIAKTWEFIGGTVKADGTIEFTVDHFSKYAVMEYNKTFADLNGHWAKEQVEILAARHIIKGVSEQNYAPEAQVTRAEFAALLVRALNLKPSAGTIRFIDLKTGDWYKQPVEIAANAGIVSGYGDKFDPNGPITREAMAAMIVRALKKAKPDGDFTAPNLKFTDAEKISAWAKDAVSVAADKGLVHGMSATAFAPQAKATRAQAAAIVYRLLKFLGKL